MLMSPFFYVYLTQKNCLFGAVYFGLLCRAGVSDVQKTTVPEIGL